MKKITTKERVLLNNSAKKVLLGAVGAASLFVASASVSASTTHKVVSNDTVWGLSQKYGVSIKSIEQLNHINTGSHLINVGQNVQIPNKGNEVKTPVKQSTPQTNITYTVKSGDSLYTIAQSHGVSVAALRQANSLTGSALQIGQKLVINSNATQSAATQVQQPTVAQDQTQSQQATATTTQVQDQAQQSTPSAQVQARPAANNYAAQNNSASTTYNTARSNYSNQSYARSQASQPQTQNNNVNAANYSSVVGYAQSFTGSSYVYGGTTPSGFDCSGFVQYVYSKYGKSLPRTSQAQASAGTRISTSQARPGDLIITNGGGHVGIATGNGNFISAENPRDGVATSNLKYWGPSYAVRLR
ncbi:NlpC P60 [Ligilactobacillus acidipiscis]|uniref:NlpC P60 n=1 Tax=Ligilactobacillus acidipiscis TaxID=89059 RepID=A0A0R2JW52_9LACO|nr:NlpC P60 [Ligilactobacillus acidipiscis]